MLRCNMKVKDSFERSDRNVQQGAALN